MAIRTSSAATVGADVATTSMQTDPAATPTAVTPPLFAYH